jgi:hypothetical protein
MAPKKRQVKEQVKTSSKTNSANKKSAIKKEASFDNMEESKNE